MSSYKAINIFPILTKFGFHQQNVIRLVHIKFHENPSIGSTADTCGQTGTDGHDEANRCFLLLMRKHLKENKIINFEVIMFTLTISEGI
jgi:hypothetical protein